MSFRFLTSLTAVVLKRLARCSIIDTESAWKVFTGDFSILLTFLIDDFSKRGQNWTRWTFIYHSSPKNNIVKGYMTRAFNQRFFLVQTNIYWLLHQLTLEGKLPVWSRTCTANEWLHQDGISESQAFWSLATEKPFSSLLFVFILALVHFTQRSLDAQVDWLINVAEIYFHLLVNNHNER